MTLTDEVDTLTTRFASVLKRTTSSFEDSKRTPSNLVSIPFYMRRREIEAFAMMMSSVSSDTMKK